MGLLSGISQLPPLLLAAKLRAMQQAQQPAPAAQPEPRRPTSFLGKASAAWDEVFTGPDDPRLTQDENAVARRQALINAGLTGLSMGRKADGFGQMFGVSALAGREVGADAREQVYAQTQTERMRQALQDPSLTRRLSPQQLALVRMMPPMQAAEFLQKLLSQESKVVGENASLVSPTGEELFYNQSQYDAAKGLPSDLVGLAQLMGVDPRVLMSLPPAQRAALQAKWEQMNASKATRVNVDARPPIQKGLDETALGWHQTATTEYRMAQDRMSSLSTMGAILDTGIKTNQLESTLMPIRGVLSAFGMADADKLGRQQAFRALAARLTLDSKEGMTGPMSDRDIKFLEGQVPQLYNTVQGNRLLIEIAQRVARARMDRALELDRYLSQNQSGVGLMQHMDEWAKAHPIDITDIRSKYGYAPKPWEK